MKYDVLGGTLNLTLLLLPHLCRFAKHGECTIMCASRLLNCCFVVMLQGKSEYKSFICEYANERRYRFMLPMQMCRTILRYITVQNYL